MIVWLVPAVGALAYILGTIHGGFIGYKIRANEEEDQ